MPVNQKGERIFDPNINKLTVANERYEDFTRALQKEIEEDCGVDFSGRTKNNKKKVNYRKGFEADPKFLQIWEKIKFHTKYTVDYSTDELIISVARAVKERPETKKPRVRSTKQKVSITDEGIIGQLLSDSGNDDYSKQMDIPDILSYIQSKTELTRDTILQILRKSRRLRELLVNPQMFMDNAVIAIKDRLHSLIIDGIKFRTPYLSQNYLL